MAIEQYNANQAIVLNSSIEKQPAVASSNTSSKRLYNGRKSSALLMAMFHAAVYKWVQNHLQPH